jgi:hypothetical protein
MFIMLSRMLFNTSYRRAPDFSIFRIIYIVGGMFVCLNLASPQSLGFSQLYYVYYSTRYYLGCHSCDCGIKAGPQKIWLPPLVFWMCLASRYVCLF